MGRRSTSIAPRHRNQYRKTARVTIARAGGGDEGVRAGLAAEPLQTPEQDPQRLNMPKDSQDGTPNAAAAESESGRMAGLADSLQLYGRVLGGIGVVAGTVDGVV